MATVSIEPEEIDPREDITIKVILNNQNVLDHPNLTINIDSNLIKEELQESLGPKEDKTIELVKKLDPMTIPQKDRLVVAVFRGDRVVVNPIIKEFKVSEYTTQRQIPKEQSFLKIRKGIEVSSNRPDYSGTIKVETTPLRNLFLSSYPRANTVKEDSRYYIIWQVKLDENRIMRVYTTENYRPIVVIIGLAIASIIIYFLFRSPIVVSKGAANIKTSHGGVAEAKIVVRVKNRSSKQMTNIEVMDTVPHIAHVEKELSIGSMQPHAILKHPKGGLVIKWSIDTLEPGDERVLSYKMKSMLPVLGEFNLPAANARCKVGNKVVISNSNRVTVST